MIVLLMAAAMTVPQSNCRPKDLWRRQAGQACLTPGPIIAPAHMEAVRRQLKSLIQSKGALDPATAAAIQAQTQKSMAAQGLRHRHGPPLDPRPFRRFDARPAPKVSPYAE